MQRPKRERKNTTLEEPKKKENVQDEIDRIESNTFTNSKTY
jgi:hypothetical protein